MTVEADVKNIERITDFVNSELERYDCPRKVMTQLDIAVDEIMSNISKYAYGNGKGDVTIRVEVFDSPKTAVISFTDNGIPFDPMAAKEPDTTLSAEDRAIGGLGLLIVRKTMDDVRYQFKDGQNIMTIKKRFD